MANRRPQDPSDEEDSGGAIVVNDSLEAALKKVDEAIARSEAMLRTIGVLKEAVTNHREG